MRACCPLAAFLKNRALVLWAAVLVPVAILVPLAASLEGDDPACSGRAAGISCEEMHRKLRPEPSGPGYFPDASYAREACPAAP